MWKVTFVLFIFVMIVDACKPSNVVTFDVTPQEFLSEYNSDVSRDLHIITFKSGIIASVDEGNQFGNLNKYTTLKAAIVSCRISAFTLTGTVGRNTRRTELNIGSTEI